MKPRIWFLYPFLLVLFLAGAWVGCSTTEPAKIPARNAGEVMVDTLLGRTPIEFVWIEPGTFIMGSPESGAQRDPNEGPQHQVTISQGFWLGKYEVTQGQWEAVMGTRPWAGEEDVRSNANHSAVYISWEDVQQLIRKLNQAEGEGGVSITDGGGGGSMRAGRGQRPGGRLAMTRKNWGIMPGIRRMPGVSARNMLMP